MNRQQRHKQKLVDAGWFFTIQIVNVIIKGRMKGIESKKWYHPQKHPQPIGFNEAYKIEFPGEKQLSILDLC